MVTELEVVIGLEIHAQISTASKLFCRCDNDAFQKEPNSKVCPICMGFPGMLPVINQEAIEKGALAAIALNCKINEKSKFDRKSYFYPDLPLGFQISQYDEPISECGYVEIEVQGKKKKIGITRLHLENDAGKSTHTPNGTLLDYNRAGSPLMEIVTEPDLRSAEEAALLAEKIQAILRYCGSSDCDMEKGMMRFDASVSLRPKGEKELRPRAEIKNLNSFRSLKSAILYEVERQKELWTEGTPLNSGQTVGWDEERQVTVLLREKESAADYRYFPEPDLPEIVISKEKFEELLKRLPELPDDKKERFQKFYGLTEPEAKFYTENYELALFFEAVAEKSNHPELAHSFVGTVLVSRLREMEMSLKEIKLTPDLLVELITCIKEGLISNHIAKSQVFDELIKTGKSPRQVIQELGLAQVSDQSALRTFCEEAIQEQPQAAEDVKNGREKALAALVGSVMKKTRGQANPQMVNEIFKELLGV